MARSLLVRGLRFQGRVLRCSAPSSVAQGTVQQQYSSVAESDLVTVAVEEKIKKSAGGGKKSITEKFLAVMEKIHDRRLPPELRRGVGISTSKADPSRVEADIMNVTEQRIVQSMMNGDFENLPGKGRPLKFETNPHADPVEDMAYRILHKNGFAPEWVELNKEIRVLIQKWRTALALAHQRKLKASCGTVESEAIAVAWKALLKEFETELGEINRKVFRYNLLAPFGRQMMSYKLEREIASLQEFGKFQQATSQGS